ncbi:MAG: Gfo/Idh/MocA family oxidoreductase [Cytophagales bacterium]|nr:Gfo/Idh/MocA family oxidoreductase [Rhizobacter sp.]
MTDVSTRPLRYAMVGGGRGALIGAVHRQAMALDGQMRLVSAALSSQPDRALASGRDLFLPDARNHASWQALLADELKRPVDERIDFVSIVTPNDLHYPVAKAFTEAGIHVVCDKPLVHTSAQAQDLLSTVARAGTVFGVTHNYTGYPMVREARALLRAGTIGKIHKVVVEYHQGWLAPQLLTGDTTGAWRTDPARSGPGGALSDVGTHAENLLCTVTGLSIESLCADLTAFIPGRRLDDDASVLLRFSNGARGVLMASQVESGCENDIRLRVFGSLGSLDWRHEEPNQLVHSPIDGVRRILTRGSPGLSESAKNATRLPPGHPEAFIEAFANIYLGVAADIRARLAGVAADPLRADYPTLADGVRGVRFVEKVIESAASGSKWTSMAD